MADEIDSAIEQYASLIKILVEEFDLTPSRAGAIIAVVMRYIQE